MLLTVGLWIEQQSATRTRRLSHTWWDDELVREVEEVTERGAGVWGGRRYAVELVISTSTWADEAGTAEREIKKWCLLCSEVGSRRFAEERERRAFIAESFSELRLERLNPPEQRVRVRPYQRLVGERLGQVWFVEDYVQLQFGDATLTLATTPLLRRDGRPPVQHGQPGYADELVGLIGATVDIIDELLDVGLVIDFSTRTRLSVSLSAQPFPEVAEYRPLDGDGWIWIGGEPPWDG